MSRKIRYKSIKYVLHDEKLYYRTIDGVLMKCLNKEESNFMKDEFHEGVCGTYQLSYKMKWMI